MQCYANLYIKRQQPDDIRSGESNVLLHCSALVLACCVHNVRASLAISCIFAFSGEFKSVFDDSFSSWPPARLRPKSGGSSLDLGMETKA